MGVDSIRWGASLDITLDGKFGSAIRRTLAHVLDSTQAGFSSPPISCSTVIFDSSSVIPVELLSSCIIKVPSVFQRS